MSDRRTFLKRAGALGAMGLTGTAGCVGQFGSQAYGNGTVEFMMSPSEPQELMMSQYQPYGNYLEDQLDNAGVKLQYAANYSAVLQGLGSATADVAETGPFAAALGVKDDKAEIALQRFAFGSWDYTSVIVTQADSGISSLTDLEGKKIAFADMTSASGSLYPLFMLKQAGLNIGNAPVSDKGADFTGTWSGHAQAFQALSKGQVDAAGVGKFITLNDSRELKEGFEFVETTSGIPRAPIVVSPELSGNEQEQIVDALKNAPEEAYLGADGEEGTDDDLWFSDVRPAELATYQEVINVADELGLGTGLLDQGAGG